LFFVRLIGGGSVDLVKVLVESAVSREEVHCGIVVVPFVAAMCVDLYFDGIIMLQPLIVKLDDVFLFLCFEVVASVPDTLIAESSAWKTLQCSGS
jgi:hypothetical protein